MVRLAIDLMPDTPSRIFISHASQNRRIAETLCTTIESRGLRCWIARRDIGPGESFQEAIVRAIRSSYIMLLTFTKSANTSDEVKKELAVASLNKLVVIPLRFEDVAPSDAFAFEFATRQWIDMFENWDRAVEQLMARLITLHPQEGRRFSGGLGSLELEWSHKISNKQRTAEHLTDDIIEHIEAPYPQISSLRTTSLLSRKEPQEVGPMGDSGTGVIAGQPAGLSPQPARAPPPALPAPRTDRPMVVVLPFESIGSDPEQVWFANGLTADLLIDLARFQDLHIVSPQQSGFGLISSGSDVPGLALPAAATYICSGSVRRAGGRIRVSVQLGDARTRITLWAERYDRPLGGLFSVQEELAERLPAHLASRVTREGTLRAQRNPPASMDAYDLCLRGRELHIRATEADTLAARDIFARAIELDPHYATAYAWQAYTVQRGFTHRWGEPRGRPAAVLALDFARRSVELEPESSLCLARLAFVLLLNAKWREALETGRVSVLANPCSAETRHCYSDILVHAGDPVAAEREIRLALSLDPFYPPTWRTVLGRALLLADRREEALSELRWCAARLPGYAPCYIALAVAAAETGRVDEARAAVQALLRINPRLTVRNIGETLFFREPATLERFRVGYRAAGMPES
jgi:TolB-like protein/Flp pilus assembly protein TadD